MIKSPISGYATFSAKMEEINEYYQKRAILFLMKYSTNSGHEPTVACPLIRRYTVTVGLYNFAFIQHKKYGASYSRQSRYVIIIRTLYKYKTGLVNNEYNE